MSNLLTQATFMENLVPTLFNIEDKCKIFSSKAIINPLSALSATNEDDYEQLEEYIEQMEQRIHDSERVYQRKINGLINKLNR